MFEIEIAKVYIKSFPTYMYVEQNFKGHIFIKFLATQCGHSISGESTMQIYAYTILQEIFVTSKVEKNNFGETGDALKMQMRVEKRLRPKTVS